jgi:hypothetical protein
MTKSVAILKKIVSMKNVIITLLLLLSSQNCLFAQNPQSRSYLELNAGAARIFYDSYFPGISFLIGQQKFIAPQAFVEYQIGLALPSLGTAKVGLGYQASGVGFSAGVRIFPAFFYGQVHFNTRRGQVNISAEKSPFDLNNWDIGPSFGADHIFTLAYQWNIGKSRKK